MADTKQFESANDILQEIRRKNNPVAIFVVDPDCKVQQHKIVHDYRYGHVHFATVPELVSLPAVGTFLFVQGYHERSYMKVEPLSYFEFLYVPRQLFGIYHGDRITFSTRQSNDAVVLVQLYTLIERYVHQGGLTEFDLRQLDNHGAQLYRVNSRCIQQIGYTFHGGIWKRADYVASQKTEREILLSELFHLIFDKQKMTL